MSFDSQRRLFSDGGTMLSPISVKRPPKKLTCHLDAKKDSFLNKQGSCIKKKKRQLPGPRSNKQAAEEAEAAFLSHHAVEIYGARGKSWPNFLQAALNRSRWGSHS